MAAGRYSQTQTTLTKVLAVTCFLAACLHVTSANYLLQIPVYVDEPALARWKKDNRGGSWADLKTEISAIMKKADKSFGSLDTMAGKDPLNIHLEVTNITLLTASNFKFPKGIQTYGNGVLGQDGMMEFYKWLKKEDTKYDLAVLFTGYDVFGGRTNNAPLGMSFIGRMCQDFSVSLIEITSRDPHNVAHEIGHNLGALHDGSKSGCPIRRNYVMYSSAQREPHNAMPFSLCSYKDISQYLHRHHSCLHDGDLKGHTDREHPLVGVKMLNKTVDEVCREAKGGGYWEMYRSYYQAGYGDKFCSDLVCVEGTGYFHYGNVPDGLKCGKSKLCYKGECVPSTYGDPDTPDFCPWGDQTLSAIGMKGMPGEPDPTCQKPDEDGYCSFRVYCCRSCGRADD